MQTATLAGGCFWCTEAIFQRIKGVEKTVSGYSGDAEAVQIFFDPQAISFEKILEVFFKTHDPTSLNRQGADVGTLYRSAIFYHDMTQKEISYKVKEKIATDFPQPIVTEIVPFEIFFPAKDYHQDYYRKNSEAPYCRLVINPKLDKLQKNFAKELKKKYP